MHAFLYILISAILVLSINSCSEKSKSSSNDFSNNNKAYPSQLDPPDYNKLSAQNKYRVVDKLLSTLYKGIAPEDFFEIKDNLNDLKPKYEDNYLDKIKSDLQKPLNPEDKYTIVQRINERYQFTPNAKYPQYILAMLYEFPLSKDYYDMWMAYFLSNTILFSPAVELESVDYIDIHRVFQRLYTMISEDQPIKEIVYQHMISQENWRRFRSPEDNTREMMEIFLERFIDEEVPKASIACQNWYLTDDTGGYSLVIDYNENTEPQNILDTWVTTCYDFYRAIVEHKDFMPTVVRRILRHLFSTYSEEDINKLTEAILEKNPQTFRDLFNLILFSKEYLLNAERPKNFEELFFPIAYKIKWKPATHFFKSMYPIYWKPPGWSSLHDMKQSPFTYKLGRYPVPPLDYLSFAYYHKAVRELLLIERYTNDFDPYDLGWTGEFIDNMLSGDDFIHYIFLATLGRKATQKELNTLNQIYDNLGYDDSFTYKDEKALIALDYISRLPELYLFTSIK